MLPINYQQEKLTTELGTLQCFYKDVIGTSFRYGFGIYQGDLKTNHVSKKISQKYCFPEKKNTAMCDTSGPETTVKNYVTLYLILFRPDDGCDDGIARPHVRFFAAIIM